jgi:hypothetical protein
MLASKTAATRCEPFAFWRHLSIESKQQLLAWRFVGQRGTHVLIGRQLGESRYAPDRSIGPADDISLVRMGEVPQLLYCTVLS